MNRLTDLLLKNIFEFITFNCKNEFAIKYYFKTIRLVCKRWKYVFMEKTRKEYKTVISNIIGFSNPILNQLSIDSMLDIVINITSIPINIPHRDKLINNIISLHVKIKNIDISVDTNEGFIKFFKLNDDSLKETYDNFKSLKLTIYQTALHIASGQRLFELIKNQQLNNGRFMNLSTLVLISTEKIGKDENIVAGLEILNKIPSITDLTISKYSTSIDEVIGLIKNTKSLKELTLIQTLPSSFNLKDILQALSSNNTLNSFYFSTRQENVEYNVSDLINLLNTNSKLTMLHIYGCKYHSDYEKGKPLITNSTINEMSFDFHNLTSNLLEIWYPDTFVGSYNYRLDSIDDNIDENLRYWKSILPNLTKLSFLEIPSTHFKSLSEFKFTNLKTLYVQFYDQPIDISTVVSSLTNLESITFDRVSYEFLCQLISLNLPNLKSITTYIIVEYQGWNENTQLMIDSIERNQYLTTLYIDDSHPKSNERKFFSNLMSILTKNKVLKYIRIPNMDPYPFYPKDHLEEFKSFIQKCINESRLIECIHLNSNYIHHTQFLKEMLINC